MLTVLGIVFLALIFGIIFFKFGLSLIQAVGGFIGALIGLASMIGLVVLIACLL